MLLNGCMKTTTNETIDLRNILDDPRWRASEELQTLLRKPLVRRLVGKSANPKCDCGAVNEKPHRESGNEIAQHDNLVVLNDWLAERSRRNFGSEQQSC